MRKNTGMAYKRRQRNAKIQREKALMLRSIRKNYSFQPVTNQSFDEYLETDPYVKERLRRAGYYSKRSYFYGSSSTVCKAWDWWSFYSLQEIRNAQSALSAYVDYEIPEESINKSEAMRKANNSDRKAARFRRRC